MFDEFEFVIASYLIFSFILGFAAVKNLLKLKSANKTFNKLQQDNADK